MSPSRSGSGNGRTGDALTVFLFEHEAVLAVGEARALGPEGAVVAALPGMVPALPAGLRLDIGLGIEANGITRRYRIPARVVRQDAEAVGLAFDPADRALVEVVTRALAERPREK